MKAESKLNTQATSCKGAVGLMQVMPTTAEWLQTEMGIESDKSLYDPEHNIKLGVRYFDIMLQQFGDLEKAITAYRIGPNKLIQHLEEGTETESAYLQEVLTYYAEFKAKN